jgi:hypothetical protein
MKKFIYGFLFVFYNCVCFGQTCGDSIIQKYNEKNILISQKCFDSGDSLLYQSRGGILRTYKYNYKNQLFEYDYACTYHVDTTFYWYKELYKYNSTGNKIEIFKFNRFTDRTNIYLTYDKKNQLIKKEEIIFNSLDNKEQKTIYEYSYNKEGKQTEKIISDKK